MPEGNALQKAALLGAAFLFLASGCANSPDAFGGSRGAVVTWAEAHGFSAAMEPAGDFKVFVAERTSPKGNSADTLTLYIEGDGAAWPSIYRPPGDPTPEKPIAMALAAADDSGSPIAYLGRPCQYLDAVELQACSPAYWTTRRFSPEVVRAYDELVSRLKSRHRAQSVRLVGYSGGGVIAALVASRRNDVSDLVTVAAPLALRVWTNHHGVSPLAGSLDPLDMAGRLTQGMHWTGERDRTVPPSVVAHFVAAKGGRTAALPGFDHECCWTRAWPNLLSRSLEKEKTP